jgi:hypothetical protein
LQGTQQANKRTTDQLLNWLSVPYCAWCIGTPYSGYLCCSRPFHWEQFTGTLINPWINLSRLKCDSP